MGFFNDKSSPDEAAPEQEDLSLEDWDALIDNIPADELPEQEEPQEGILGKLLSSFSGKGKNPPSEDATTSAESTPKKATKKKSKSKLKNRQKVILLIMGALVFACYVALIMIVTRTLPNNIPATTTGDPADGITITINTPASQVIESDVSILDYTPEPTPEDALVTPSPTPAAVFTSYDRQIQSNPNDKGLLLKRGAEYIKAGAYEAAINDYQRAVAIDKEDPAAYIGLGQAYFYLNRWNEAEEAYGTSIAFDHNFPAAHFGLATIYYHKGQLNDAMREFDWAAEIDPSYAEAEAWLAISAARAGNNEEALGAIGRAISLTEELPIVYIAKSWQNRTQNPPDLEEALGNLLYARELDQYTFETLNALARFYQDHRPERWIEAEQIAQYALNWAKNDFERALGLHTLGRIYESQERIEDARRTYQEAVDLVSSDGEIMILELDNDYQEANAP